MIVAECTCGEEVPIVLEERTTTPIKRTCDCGRIYEMTVNKVYDPEWKPGVKTDG